MTSLQPPRGPSGPSADQPSRAALDLYRHLVRLAVRAFYSDQCPPLGYDDEPEGPRSKLAKVRTARHTRADRLRGCGDAGHGGVRLTTREAAGLTGTPGCHHPRGAVWVRIPSSLCISQDRSQAETELAVPHARASACRGW